MSDYKQSVKGDLNQIMEDSDWALIFDDLGALKGIFIPEGKEEKDVPEPLKDLLALFNLDMDDAEDTTIH